MYSSLLPYSFITASILTCRMCSSPSGTPCRVSTSRARPPPGPSVPSSYDHTPQELHHQKSLSSFISKSLSPVLPHLLPAHSSSRRLPLCHFFLSPYSAPTFPRSLTLVHSHCRLLLRAPTPRSACLSSSPSHASSLSPARPSRPSPAPSTV